MAPPVPDDRGCLKPERPEWGVSDAVRIEQLGNAFRCLFRSTMSSTVVVCKPSDLGSRRLVPSSCQTALTAVAVTASNSHMSLQNRINSDTVLPCLEPLLAC
jgi:hypothetical protein